jgi:hypothetical protein
MFHISLTIHGSSSVPFTSFRIPLILSVSKATFPKKSYRYQDATMNQPRATKERALAHDE